MVVQSAVLAYVFNERPGATITDLSDAMLTRIPAEHGDDAVERAVHDLVRRRFLRMEDGRVFPPLQRDSRGGSIAPQDPDGG